MKIRRVEFEQYVVDSGASIRDVLEKLNSLAGKPCLVVDSNQTCLGVVTDGDIRRMLLREMDSSTLVAPSLTSFYWVQDSAGRESVLELMRKKSISIVPVLNKSGHLTGIWESVDEEARKPYSIPVLILAGGKGTRLRPLTESVPKPLIKVGGVSLLDRTVEKFINDGFSQFFVSVNYLRDQVVGHLANHKWQGCNFDFIEEESPLGTAGPIGLISEKEYDSLFVANADVLHNIDLAQMLETHLTSQANLTVAVRLHETTIPFGVLEIQGAQVTRISEKPSFSHPVSAGLYIIDRAVASLVSGQGPMDMPELIMSAISKGLRVNAYLVHEYWLDVGTPESLALAEDQSDSW